MYSLIINPESPCLKELIDQHSNISTQIIHSSIDIAKNFIHKDVDRFSFEMRQYDLPPQFHGFLLNEDHLFLGFTEIKNKKLFGGKYPYVHIHKKGEEASKITKHYFRFFESWFDMYWKDSKEVVNVKK